jgi:hypothetical protein
VGNWLGSWVGKWFGANIDQPEGSISGSATFSLSATGELTNGETPQIIASLGGFSQAYKKPEELPEEVEIIQEAIPEAYISRIRNEFLSEALAKDLINRAKQRKSRAEEEALLIIL